MSMKSFFVFVFLCLVVIYASPVVQIRESPITLHIAVRVNATGGASALIKADMARFASMRAQNRLRAKDGSFPVALKNGAVTYTGVIEVGRPSTAYTLLVDTGSSNTWIGAGKGYTVTSTSERTPDSVSVTYGSGSFSGKEYNDTLSFGTTGTSWKQSIGVASNSTGFAGVDGILGLGPRDLTLGTLSPNSQTEIPTVTDNLKSQGLISTAQIGISFQPSTNAFNGELTFGGPDLSKYIQPVNFVPLTSKFPASAYWGINQGITYGTASEQILSSSSAGIVDTGTTLLYLPTDAFSRYISATGASPDSKTGLLRISAAQFSKLQSLLFTIGGVTYEFTANAQIWPRALNVAIGGSAQSIYLVVADSGARTGSGMDFINGFVWLQRFYSIYDTDNKRIGFATTPFTTATTN